MCMHFYPFDEMLRILKLGFMSRVVTVWDLYLLKLIDDIESVNFYEQIQCHQ